MSDIKKFQLERSKRIETYNSKSKIFKKAFDFFKITNKFKYTYNFEWLGIPIIQFPQDIIALQEIIFKTKPNIIIETGIARGGSLIFYSSLMSLIHKKYKVIGIDNDIRDHNLKNILKNPLSKNIKMLEGDSISIEIQNKIKDYLRKIKIKNKKIMVCLDSKHTHAHVLNELKLYSKFVSSNCYLIVFDTTDNLRTNKDISEISRNYRFKPYGKNSNPHSAVKEFLKNNDNFSIDESFHRKTLITNCYEGFLLKNKNN